MAINDGYSICFNEWSLDKDIKNELGLLLIISSLCAEKGYCFASNEYLAEKFEIDEATISRKIKKLEDKGYINIVYKKRGCEVVGREIRLTKISTDDCQKYQPTIDEKVKDNNTSINNTSINKKEIYKEKVKHKYGEYGNVLLTDEQLDKLKTEFTNWEELIQRVDDYCQSTGKHYKDYLATIRNWVKRDKQSPKQPKKEDIKPIYEDMPW